MFVIGIDVGTTGAKALAVSEAGKVLGSGYMGYALEVDGVRVEQDVSDWWTAACAAVRQAIGELDCSTLRAISLSTQGASMVALDAENRPIGRALTWLDGRAEAQSDALRERLGEDAIYHTTGWRASPALDAAKILWMKGQPSHAGARKYLSTLEYMNFRLTGRMAIDPTNAGIRQLMDIRTCQWDGAILSAIGADATELPEILPAGAKLGTLCPEAAKALGLPKDVTVYNGAHDQYCASLGIGATRAGDMLLSTGTTWVVMATSDRPLWSDSYIAVCAHPVQGLYGNMVSLTGAGAAYQWTREKLLMDEPFERIADICQSRVGNRESLFFLPWLSGAGYPFWNSAARGGFFGADLKSDGYDLALAVMESAAFGVRGALLDFERSGCPASALTAMGGATRSEFWMRMLASVLDMPVRVSDVVDVCALGAASIALCAEGCFPDYRAAASALTGSRIVLPDSEWASYYRSKYAAYQRFIRSMDALCKEV